MTALQPKPMPFWAITTLVLTALTIIYLKQAREASQ